MLKDKESRTPSVLEEPEHGTLEALHRDPECLLDGLKGSDVAVFGELGGNPTPNFSIVRLKPSQRAFCFEA
jgi:hypothetical protein